MLSKPLRKTASTAAAAAIAMCVLPAAAVELLVPAYFYPSFDPALSQWDEMTAAVVAGTKITAIVNPNNGPGSAINSDYTRAINDFRAAGGKVLGYVYTCYGNNTCNPALPALRTTADVLADAQKYQTWYSVDGIFLDEMSNQAAALPFYTTIAQGLRAAQPSGQIFGNPGTSTPASYLTVADTIVTFERGTGSYAGASSEPWMTTAAPNRQAHLHYGVSSEAAMRDLLQQAVARNAGYVYISNDVLPNPWDQLPSYWLAEVAAVSSVPEVSSAALMGLGGWMLAAALRRRKSAKSD
jgi:Spherulation-specific family 4